MPNVRAFSSSFNGGEVTPEFFGQLGDAKFRTGLARMRNYIALPHGPATNRPGTAFVREVKDSTKRVRLLPFNYSTTQTMVLEVGPGYIRFHTQGATLLYSAPAAYNGATAYTPGDMVASGGTNYYCIANTTGNAPPNATYWYALPASVYEIPTPYAEADLFDLHHVQSADVLTIVHPGYAPRELRRQGATRWVLSTISFAPTLSAPGGVAVVATVGAGATTYTYKVTAIADGVLDESVASASANCTNNLLTTGNYNTVSWGAVTGAKRYSVYKQSNGLFGYIGQTDGTSFIDDNIAADLSSTPPESYTPFASSGNYPGAVSYFDQRRCFAGTTNAPQTVWMTRTGTESNLNYSLPTRDDDSITFRFSARENNTIRHLVPLQNLVLLTSSSEVRVTSINSDAITPTSVSAKPQSYVGASNVQPVIANTNLVYPAARGGHMFELAYSWQANGYVTGDLSLRAPHLFDTLSIVDMAYQKAPTPIVWAVSSNGVLLGNTYVPQQQVGAWHWHDTLGTWESIAVVAEGNEDAIYLLANRTIGGNTKRYVERMAPRVYATLADAFFVDAGATYSGASTLTVSGLSHLEGETVAVLADGAVLPERVVTGGSITLDAEASKVQVGLPFTSDLQLLPFAAQIGEAFGQGRRKNINRAFIRISQSSGIFAGPDFGSLREYKQRTDEAYGTPPDRVTGVVEIVVDPSWDEDGALCIRQSYPLPSTVVSVTAEVAIGG